MNNLTKAKPKNKVRNPPIITEYDRTAFELTITKHAITVGKIIEKHKRGAVTNEDYCILFNDAMEMFKEIAYGWWNNAAMRRNPKSKWATEQRAKLFREYIEEAFTVRPASQPAAAHDAEKPPH